MYLIQILKMKKYLSLTPLIRFCPAWIFMLRKMVRFPHQLILRKKSYLLRMGTSIALSFSDRGSINKDYDVYLKKIFQCFLTHQQKLHRTKFRPM